MNDLIDFFMQNIWQSAAFFGLIIAYIVFEFTQKDRDSLSPQQAVSLINHDNAGVLDLRPNDSYSSSHIVGSMNLTANNIDKKNKKLSKYIKKPLILVCQTGKTCPKIVKQLKKDGFANVNYIAGGIEAWQRESLPLVNK